MAKTKAQRKFIGQKANKLIGKYKALNLRAQGYTFPEIKDKLGVSLTTAHNWVRQALTEESKKITEKTRHYQNLLLSGHLNQLKRLHSYIEEELPFSHLMRTEEHITRVRAEIADLMGCKNIMEEEHGNKAMDKLITILLNQDKNV